MPGFSERRRCLNFMKGIFLGCTTFSEELLKRIIEVDAFEIQAIFSIPKAFKISYSEEEIVNSMYADLKPYADELNVPFVEINSEEGRRLKDHVPLIRELSPDVMLVLGWYYMVPAEVRELAKSGAWGIHASLLPKYAGGAPLVWAMIEGETETGVTLFKLDDGIDDGDIIDQKKFTIDDDDTISEVYDKAILASKEILADALNTYPNINFSPQDKSGVKVWPQRSPEDGRIDWNWDSKRIRNFIRAQTRPYPGAWTEINGKKVTIWDADISQEQ